MLYGYAGKILHVDLTEKHIYEERLDPDITINFIGGYGIMARLLYNHIPPGCDPLGPDNILGIMTGPLTGSGVPTGTRWTACCKSPLTGTWGDANGSGYFGPALKAAGYDGIMLSGINNQPCYLLIDNGRVSLHSASDLWGKDTYEVDDLLKDRHGKDSESICIGPAGELLTLISGIVHAKGRVAARSGVGAVMGCKKLKAVVVKGSIKPPFANPKLISELRKKYNQQINDGVGFSEYYRTTGTPGYIEPGVEVGDSPIMNWQGTSVDFGLVDQINHEQLYKLGRKKRTCWQCPIGCWGELPKNGNFVHQPEYETASAFGSDLLMSDPECLLTCTDICNRYGLDTISAGAVLAFAIDCFEAGVIDETDLGGLRLQWGGVDGIQTLLQQIANRVEFGAILADGVMRAAEWIGKESEEHAIHVGGQELPMHDPRYEPGLGLVYVADATPGRHGQASQFLPPVGLEVGSMPGFGEDRERQSGRGHYMKPLACLNHVVNASGLCLFGHLSMTVDLLPKWLTAVTGTLYDLEQVQICGERIANMRQVFNVREGINLMDYRLPKRVYQQALDSGPTAGVTVNIRTMLHEHLEDMGWDHATATPSRATLEKLGLWDVANDLWGAHSIYRYAST